MNMEESTSTPFGFRNEPLIVHLFWAQGWHAAPEFVRVNRRKWEDSGASVQVWDIESACAFFPFFAEHQSAMAHHAMRADVLLALAAYRFGGFIIGTDMTPVDPASMFEFAHSVPGLAVRRLEGGVHNGGSYFARGHPFLKRVIELLAASHTLSRLDHRHVATVTGPHLWSKVMQEHCWLVAKVMTGTAFTHGRLRGRTVALNESGWLNPGFRASWKTWRR